MQISFQKLPASCHLIFTTVCECSGTVTLEWYDTVNNCPTRRDYTRGDPKISGIVIKIYLNYSYKFQTLVPFKALPLWLDTAIPAMFPLLETLSKIFNRNAVKGCQRFSLNLCNVSKMPPFQNLFHPWVQKKSQRARSGK